MELNEKIAITPEIQGLIDKLPTNVTTSGKDVNLQSMVLNALNMDSVIDREEEFYQTLQECPDTASEKLVLKIFLRTIGGWDMFKGSEEQLLNAFQQLGVRSEENPFIRFMQKYPDEVRGMTTVGISGRNIAMLFNLLASDVIDDQDLMGTSQDGYNSIIYNPNLYALTPSDAEFLISSYKWLSEGSNVQRMNFPAIVADTSLPNLIRDRFDKSKPAFIGEAGIKDSDAVKASILFNDIGKPHGKLIDRRYVQKALSDASSRRGMDRESTEDKVRRILLDINRLSDADREVLIRELSRKEG